MARRPTAAERLQRLLVIVPWIVANPGHKLSDVAARFGLSEDALRAGLDVVWMVGLPPYTPDSLIEVVLEVDEAGADGEAGEDEGDERVSIRLADYFSRPLRFTSAEALALLASSDGLLAVPGTDPHGALARALKKLGDVLGVSPEQAIAIDLGPGKAAMIGQLRDAAATGHQVEIEYYAYNRDERTTRTIEPWQVFASTGAWYVNAWCHLAGGRRLFRIDRIAELRPAGLATEPRPAQLDKPGVVFDPGPDDPRVVLRLGPEAAWVAETYPVTVLDGGDGAGGGSGGESTVVELVVSAVPWFERLMVRLGPAAEIVSAEGLADAEQLGPRAASRMLARYRTARS